MPDEIDHSEGRRYMDKELPKLFEKLNQLAIVTAVLTQKVDDFNLNNTKEHESICEIIKSVPELRTRIDQHSEHFKMLTTVITGLVVSVGTALYGAYFLK